MSVHDWPVTPRGWQRRSHLIIGQAPARSALPDTRPWDSDSGKRLAKLMGLRDTEELLRTFDTTNLNRELRGTVGRWDVFEMTEAAVRAEKLRDYLGQWRTVLCCGARVGKLMGATLLEWATTDEGTWLGAIPHPGGTNFYWNSKKNRDEAQGYLGLYTDYLRWVA